MLSNLQIWLDGNVWLTHWLSDFIRAHSPKWSLNLTDENEISSSSVWWICIHYPTRYTFRADDGKLAASFIVNVSFIFSMDIKKNLGWDAIRRRRTFLVKVHWKVPIYCWSSQAVLKAGTGLTRLFKKGEADEILQRSISVPPRTSMEVCHGRRLFKNMMSHDLNNRTTLSGIKRTWLIDTASVGEDILSAGKNTAVKYPRSFLSLCQT